VSVIDCLHAKKPEMFTSNFLLLQVYNINVEEGTLDLTEKYTVSESDYATWTKNIEVCTGDCIITNAGIVGAIAQIPVNFAAGIGRNITAIRPESIPPTYLLSYLKSNYGQKEIERNTDQGTIFNSLNVKGIRKMLILVPPEEVVTHFESACRPLRERVERNSIESSSLKDIRDLFLPKLMSGQIRVPLEVR
jgi:type I restriction enzyme S subunit